jgi:hypothetical protein
LFPNLSSEKIPTEGDSAGISDQLTQGFENFSYSVASEGLTIKSAIAPKIGTQITIITQIAFVVEDKVLSFSLNREIIDKTIQNTSRTILKICKTTEIAKFCIIFPF